MSGFGAKARQFMGWYTPEEVDESTLDFLPEEVEETEVAHITPASNVTPIHRASVELQRCAGNRRALP